jgi:hypothetical protein
MFVNFGFLLWVVDWITDIFKRKDKVYIYISKSCRGCDHCWPALGHKLSLTLKNWHNGSPWEKTYWKNQLESSSSL